MNDIAVSTKEEPAVKHASGHESTLPSIYSESITSRMTALIVDDDKHSRAELEKLLKDENLLIIAADSAASALRIMDDTEVNLIIASYQMPGVSGTEFLRVVKQTYPDVVRIMLTGHADINKVMEAINEGILYKFILKPWNNDDLKVTVHLALRQYELILENKRLRRITEQRRDGSNKATHRASVDRTALGNILVEKKLLLPAQLEMVMKYLDQKKVTLAKSLVELGMLDEATLYKVIQDESGASSADLDQMQEPKELSRILPRAVCEEGSLVPVKMENSNLYVAMADPLDLSRIEHIGFTAKAHVTPLLASLTEIEHAIEYLYGESGADAEATAENLDYVSHADEIDVLLDEEDLITVEQLMAKSASPPAVSIVNTIVAEAIRLGASDIHIEPKAAHTSVRYRIDGILQQKITVPLGLHLTTISRLKILSKMDIAERRMPQDGRITVKAGDKIVDIRVSSMPTLEGEKIVCRLLNKNASIWALDDIGICGDALDRLKLIIGSPQGMIIATGPTGSGKTTSLYSMMNARQSESLNFVTIEDPVEYSMENATQVHVNQKIGLTFASTLRATLRQDPDVILVGEIRDEETAVAAFQAAMTGHLVFTTLHTNSTVATISRLLHLKTEPFLVASAVQGIIAQRLVRKICPHCRDQREFEKGIMDRLGVKTTDLPEKFDYGAGCDRCSHTGYIGRTGLYEVFLMNSQFRHFLTTDYHESRLLEEAKSLGMETLLEDGIRKVVDGVTTLDELLRVLGPAMEY